MRNELLGKFQINSNHARVFAVILGIVRRNEAIRKFNDVIECVDVVQPFGRFSARVGGNHLDGGLELK